MLSRLIRSRAVLQLRPLRMASFSTTSPKASKKKIIVCCDGTWQSSVSAQLNIPSNVTRLARRFSCSGVDSEDGEHYNQVVYYDSGVGTGDIGFQSKIQGASGSGLDTNVIEAYNFIVLNYAEGDKIYCFGFSRGAYTARCVAGLVTDIGIIKPRDMNEFPMLYRLYQQNNRGDQFRNTIDYHNWVQGVPADPFAAPQGLFTEEEATNLARRKGEWLSRPHGFIKQETRFVEVVGVFDTVGSLGVPDIQGIDMSYFNSSHGFHNVRLSPFIKNAFHAMALDERRGPFSPTLWYIPYDRKKKQDASTAIVDEVASEKKYNAAVIEEHQAIKKLTSRGGKFDPESTAAKEITKKKLEPFREFIADRDAVALKDTEQLLYQVWFPGVHINVGGGSDDLLKSKQGDLEQMANITFCWMAEMLRPHLSFDDSADQVFLEERFDAIERARHTKNYGSGMTYYLRSALELLHVKEAPTYEISEANEKGWATGAIVDSFTGMMKIAGAVNRTPGRCIDTNKDMDGIKQPLVKLGHTREFIHPSVAYRKYALNPHYDPPALEGFEAVLVPDGPDRKIWKWVKPDGGLKWSQDPKTGEDVWTEGKVIIPEWWIYPTKGSDTGMSEKEQAKYKSFERLCMPVSDPERKRGTLPQEPKDWLHATRDSVYKNTTEWKTALSTRIDGE